MEMIRSREIVAFMRTFFWKRKNVLSFLFFSLQSVGGWLMITVCR